jgi:hypothetical protein
LYAGSKARRNHPVITSILFEHSGQSERKIWITAPSLFLLHSILLVTPYEISRQI